MNRKTGFTLIELLIVVAIIAILAAIAVPNFLEAQTRAKVSRTENDLRTIDLAMETYFIDNNGYPAAYRDSWLIQPLGSQNVAQCYPPHLTTPISYLTDIPVDIFRKNASTSGLPYRIYAVGLRANGSVDYWTYPRSGYMTWSFGADEVTQTGGYRSLKTVLKNEALPVPTTTDGMRYDPTNGTVSAGDLYRFNGVSKQI